jgi:hypothetical protein
MSAIYANHTWGSTVKQVCFFFFFFFPIHSPSFVPAHCSYLQVNDALFGDVQRSIVADLPTLLVNYKALIYNGIR